MSNETTNENLIDLEARRLAREQEARPTILLVDFSAGPTRGLEAEMSSRMVVATEIATMATRTASQAVATSPVEVTGVTPQLHIVPSHLGRFLRAPGQQLLRDIRTRKVDGRAGIERIADRVHAKATTKRQK